MVALNKKLKFLTLQQVNVISVSLLQILAAIENYQCSRMKILHMNCEILVTSYKIVIITIIIIIIIIIITIIIISSSSSSSSISIIIIIIIIIAIAIIVVAILTTKSRTVITTVNKNKIYATYPIFIF